MIKSFCDAEAAKIFRREASRKLPPDIQQRGFQKLNALAAAIRLEDLRLPPSNRLEPLKGNREGKWSIRINDQWRLCFRWEVEGALDVEIVDYHK